MTSFICIADIPRDEWHLLPIIGLRQQLREDRNRPRPPTTRTDQGERDGSRPDQALHTEAPGAEVWADAGGAFVTHLQLQDEPRPRSRLPFDREDIDDHEDRDDEDFDDSQDEDTGEEDDWRHTGGRLTSFSRSRSMPAERV